MKTYSFNWIVFLFLIGFSTNKVLAQSDRLATKPATFRAYGQEHKGFSIDFDFTEKEVFKAWWKYSRAFSRNETKKNSIRHTIPPNDGEANVPIVFVSQVASVDSLNSKISAAVSDTGINSDKMKGYNDQVRELLIEFKVSYYKENLQRKINQTEKLAGKIGRQLDQYTSKDIKLRKKLAEPKTSNDEALVSQLKLDIASNMMKRDSTSNNLERIQKRLINLQDQIGSIQN